MENSSSTETTSSAATVPHRAIQTVTSPVTAGDHRHIQSASSTSTVQLRETQTSSCPIVTHRSITSPATIINNTRTKLTAKPQTTTTRHLPAESTATLVPKAERLARPCFRASSTLVSSSLSICLFQKRTTEDSLLCNQTHPCSTLLLFKKLPNDLTQTDLTSHTWLSLKRKANKSVLSDTPKHYGENLISASVPSISDGQQQNTLLSTALAIAAISQQLQQTPTTHSRSYMQWYHLQHIFQSETKHCLTLWELLNEYRESFWIISFDTFLNKFIHTVGQIIINVVTFEIVFLLLLIAKLNNKSVKTKPDVLRYKERIGTKFEVRRSKEPIITKAEFLRSEERDTADQFTTVHESLFLVFTSGPSPLLSHDPSAAETWTFFLPQLSHLGTTR